MHTKKVQKEHSELWNSTTVLLDSINSIKANWLYWIMFDSVVCIHSSAGYLWFVWHRTNKVYRIVSLNTALYFYRLCHDIVKRIFCSKKYKYLILTGLVAGKGWGSHVSFSFLVHPFKRSASFLFLWGATCPIYEGHWTAFQFDPAIPRSFCPLFAPLCLCNFTLQWPPCFPLLSPVAGLLFTGRPIGTTVVDLSREHVWDTCESCQDPRHTSSQTLPKAATRTSLVMCGFC